MAVRLEPAAAGFSPHSGWAAVVVLAGPVAKPALLERRRFLLAAPDDAVGKQPFHAAEEMPLPQAKRLVDRCVADSRQRAAAEMERLAADLAGKGYALRAGGLSGKEPAPLGPLAAILASHALIHAAEGEMFRDVLRDSAPEGVEWMSVREREAEARCATAVGRPVESLRAHLAALGKAAGAPWTKDQKIASLIAWACLRELHRST